MDRAEKLVKARARSIAMSMLHQLRDSLRKAWATFRIQSNCSEATSSQSNVGLQELTMAGPPKKRQKRTEKEDGSMPQKKYYRQRAHANPFSDHDLT